MSMIYHQPRISPAFGILALTSLMQIALCSYLLATKASSTDASEYDPVGVTWVQQPNQTDVVATPAARGALMYFFLNDFPSTETLRIHYEPLLPKCFSQLEADEIMVQLFFYSTRSPEKVRIIARTPEIDAVLLPSVLSEKERRLFPVGNKRSSYSERVHLVVLFFNNAQPVAVIVDLSDLLNSTDHNSPCADREFVQLLDDLRARLYVESQ